MKLFEFVLFTLLAFTARSFGQEGVCSSDTCKLPSCFCAGRQGPMQLQTKDIPQMVVFTFDDALNEDNYPFYTKLFRAGRNNPNGCPIAATFFVSHDWTNYDYVRDLYIDGHEIASHSITHKMPQSWWSRASYAELKEEFEGQRRNIVHHAKIPKSQIRGIRVPFLETGGDTQFTLMKNEGFDYDSSFIAGPYFKGDWRLPVWPYTLEYPPGLEFCDNHNCPKGNFSGIWEFPLNRWIGLDGKACPMVDACTTHNIDSKEKVLQYLRNNFNRYYGNNKAPFGINMHAKWFKQKHTLDAMDAFITELSQNEDVYIVSLHQVIQWMRNPTSLSHINSFSQWRSTCGKRRRLVSTRSQQPKPRLRVIHEDDHEHTNEISEEEEQRRTTLRTKMNNAISNVLSSQNDNADNDIHGINDNKHKEQERGNHQDRENDNVNHGQEKNVAREEKPGSRGEGNPTKPSGDQRRAEAARPRKPTIVSKQGRPVNLSSENRQNPNAKEAAGGASVTQMQLSLSLFVVGITAFDYLS